MEIFESSVLCLLLTSGPCLNGTVFGSFRSGFDKVILTPVLFVIAAVCGHVQYIRASMFVVVLCTD